MKDEFLSDAIATEIVDELPFDLLESNTVPRDMADSSELYCTECDKTGFKNPRGLKLHMTRMHGMGADKVPTGAGKRKRKATEDLRQDLEVLFSALGMGVAIVNAVDGEIIATGSPALAKALANTAEKNPKLRRFLENMTTGFVYSELLVACAAIIIPILANHNVLPQRFNVAASHFMGPAVGNSEAMWQ